ncbi:unnamed protein product, partial [Rotaria sordida]
TGCSTNIPLVATTPIDICRLEQELVGHPDKEFTSFLLSGLREGFDTGISNIPNKPLECPNLRSARRDPENVTRLVAEELDKGFLIGPYNSPPFVNYRINPIGLVESKYSKKKRLIVDLSAPHNNKDHPSINSLIDKDSYSLSYVTVDDAIKSIQKLGKGAWMNKADIQDAFKLLPIKPSLWPFYGIKWNNYYYFFVRLPFGSRSSPKLFDMLSEAIVWIAEHNYGIKNMLHLLDDFFVVDSPDDGGERTSAMISLIFNRLKIPLSVNKTVGPVQEIEYLGIILDSNRMEARLPQEKVLRIMEMIRSLLNRRKSFCHGIRNIRYSTIRSYLAAIRFYRLRAGFSDPFIDMYGYRIPQIEMILKGARRLDSLPIKQCKPITIDILNKLIRVLQCGIFNPYIDTLMQAALTTAFWGFFRSGELFPDKFCPRLHVTQADIQYDMNFIIIKLKSSKTDIERKGVNVRLFRNGSINCAVHALNCFTVLRNSNNYDSPFFLLPNGHAFTRRAFIFNLRHLLLQLGYEASAYSGHSLRVGAATSAAAAGVPDHLIQTLGRWSSLSYLRYIRVSDTVILKAHNKILQLS